VENALNLSIPANARVIRNLLSGGQFVHDHPVHFYHLSALDWVDIVSALAADPAETQDLADLISPGAPTFDFEGTQASLQKFVTGGQLGIFAGGYWGHSAYKLSPEANLLFATHYLYALRQQVKAAKMHAIFGGKNPHIQSLKVGGVTCKDEITDARISEFQVLLAEMQDFIDTVYLPDVIHLAKSGSNSGSYSEWSSYGGFSNYLSYGEFQMSDTDPADLFLPGGVILDQVVVGGVQDVIFEQINEHVSSSWYAGTTARHPQIGETIPNYTGYNTADRYSWLKAPRYNGLPMEVGPLARVLIAYGRGQTEIVDQVNTFLTETGLGLEALHSTLGRTAARAIETKVVADKMSDWLNELQVGGDTTVDVDMPGQASGVGLKEAPRGALGHWINIEGQKIGNYQMVVPSTWNLGPRCASGYRGPVEEALIGTPVADPAQPIEILRIVHSYDPCIACAVHVMDNDQNRHYSVKVV